MSLSDMPFFDADTINTDSDQPTSPGRGQAFGEMRYLDEPIGLTHLAVTEDSPSGPESFAVPKHWSPVGEGKQ